MYDEPSECGRDHVACAFDRVINTKGLTAALYEMLCNERNGDRRKRSCTEPLDEPHQHQQLWVYNEKQERAENKHKAAGAGAVRPGARCSCAIDDLHFARCKAFRTRPRSGL